MSAPSTTSSAFVGAGWFAVLLAACILAEKQDLSPGAKTAAAASDVEQAASPPDEPAMTEPARDIADLLSSRRGAPPRGSPEHTPESLVPPPRPTVAARPVTPTSQPELSQPGDRAAATGRPSAPDTLAIPLLPPPEGFEVPEELLLTVDLPDAVIEHEPALLTLRVKNPGSLPVDGVHVRARFDDAWEFPGSEELEIEQRLGTIPANSSRDATLSLIPLRSGRSEIEFRVESDLQTAFVETVAIDVQKRIVELGLAGPSRRSFGQRAEYIVTVRNTSDRDLPDARARVDFDPAALSVREASVGFEQEPGTIAWPLGTLLRDERVQIQLEFECRAELLHTPVRCSFLTAGQPAAVAEHLLEIVPATSLDVAVSDDDPRMIGEPARFTVHVRNHAATPVEGLELRIATSPHFENLAWADDARPPGENVSQDRYGIDIRQIRIPPRGEASFTFSARTTLPGDAAIRVLVRAPGQPAPFEVDESFVVNAAPDSE